MILKESAEGGEVGRWRDKGERGLPQAHMGHLQCSTELNIQSRYITVQLMIYQQYIGTLHPLSTDIQWHHGKCCLWWHLPKRFDYYISYSAKCAETSVARTSKLSRLLMSF